jgi:hypothetical protein
VTLGLRILVLLGLAPVGATTSRAGFLKDLFAREELITVTSKEFNGYVRARLPDGSRKPETYAFGEGGVLGTLIMRDRSIDDLKFPAIAQMLAEPLARQHYVPSHDPKSTELLLMVFWGTTFGADNTPDGAVQDALNFFNASLLGFESAAQFLGSSDGASLRGQIIRQTHAAEMAAIEVNRYYVILRAFDFQSAWKQKKLLLRWETRFSLSERHHGLREDLPFMAASASWYFGRDSHGLVRPPIREGHVEIGEMKVMDDHPNRNAAEDSGLPAALAGDWQGSTRGGQPLLVHLDQTGNATIENLSQHRVLPAQVSTKGAVVTVEVPGWDVLFRGKLKGDRLTGTISEYGNAASLSLTKLTKPIEGPRNPDNAAQHNDVPQPSREDTGQPPANP